MPKTLFGFYELTIREYWVQILTIFLLNIIYYAGNAIVTPISIKMVIGSIENAAAAGHNVMDYALPAVLLVCGINLLVIAAEIISDILKGKYMPRLDNAVSKRYTNTYSIRPIRSLKRILRGISQNRPNTYRPSSMDWS